MKDKAVVIQSLVIIVFTMQLYLLLLDSIDQVVHFSDVLYSVLADSSGLVLGIWAAVVLTKAEGLTFWKISLSWKKIGVVILGFVALFFWTILSFNLFPITANGKAIAHFLQTADNWWDKHVFIFMLTIIGPIYEELVFRGLMFRLCRPFKVYHLDLILSVICFTFGHLHFGQGTLWTDAMHYMGYGLVFSLCYKNTKSIYYPIALHILWNCFVAAMGHH